MSPNTESERLQQMEDRAQIQELIYAYGYHLDAHDFAAYASLFAEDGEWRNQNVSAKGPAAIEEMVAKLMSGTQPNTGVHVLTSPSITFESADVAKTKTIWAYVIPGESGNPTPSRYGRYDDTIVRVADGTWRFASRTASRSIPPLS